MAEVFNILLLFKSLNRLEAAGPCAVSPFGQPAATTPSAGAVGGAWRRAAPTSAAGAGGEHKCSPWNQPTNRASGGKAGAATNTTKA